MLFLVLVVAVPELLKTAEVHGVAPLSIGQPLADGGSELQVTPHDHLPFRDGYHRDEQEDAIHIVLNAVAPPWLRSGPAEADPAAGVHLNLSDCLEMLWLVANSCGSHHHLPDGSPPSTDRDIR